MVALSLQVKQSQIKFRARYAETDAMGIVHHSNYVIWLEMGRVALMTELGMPYREVEKRGINLVVTGLGLKYRRPALFDDEILLTTRLGSVKSRLVRFEYSVERLQDQALLAEGFTEHIATDSDKRTVPIPEYLRDLLESA